MVHNVEPKSCEPGVSVLPSFYALHLVQWRLFMVLVGKSVRLAWAMPCGDVQGASKCACIGTRVTMQLGVPVWAYLSLNKESVFHTLTILYIFAGAGLQVLRSNNLIHRDLKPQVTYRENHIYLNTLKDRDFG